MPIQKTMLIGNGVNRINFAEGSKSKKGPPSWKDSLELLAKFAERKVFNIDKKPLTLVFDEIAYHSRDSDISKFALQKHIADIAKFEHNPIADLLYSLTTNVLTTNYSTHHVAQFDKRNRATIPARQIQENTFSLFRHYATPEDRRLWFIHGSSDQPTSLTLGFKQCAKYQDRIQTYLKSGLVSGGKKIKNSPLFRKNPVFDFDKRRDHYSWVDIFLRDEIHVVGLGLDYTETILWWLLLEKLYLKAKYPKHIGDFIYHHIETNNKKMSERDENKLDMLHSFGITVKYSVVDSYREGYLDIAEKIKSGSKAKYEKQQQAKLAKDASSLDGWPVKPKQNPSLIMPADQL
jgi:hypothetical protein